MSYYKNIIYYSHILFRFNFLNLKIYQKYHSFFKLTLRNSWNILNNLHIFNYILFHLSNNFIFHHIYLYNLFILIFTILLNLYISYILHLIIKTYIYIFRYHHLSSYLILRLMDLYCLFQILNLNQFPYYLDIYLISFLLN